MMRTQIHNDSGLLTVRRGFMAAGFFALALAALFALAGAGFGCDGLLGGDVTLAATGAVATVTKEAMVSGEELSTEKAKELSGDLLEDSVSDKVTEIYSDVAPVFAILNRTSKVKVRTKNGTFARVHRFYQIDQRPIRCSTTASYAGGTTLGAELSVDNISMWTKDSVVRPIIATPTAAQKGYVYENGIEAQRGELQLIVVAVNRSTSKLTVQALNARRSSPDAPDTAYVPAIPSGTTLIRLAPLASETDASTDSFGDFPTTTSNYVATFHSQFEITPDYLRHGKEINWGEAQIKDRNLQDMYRTIEMSLLVGQRAMISDVVDGDVKYQLGGFLFYNTNELEYNVNSGSGAGLTGNDFNRIMQKAFAGNNGSKNRLLLMGSGFAGRAQLIRDFQKYNLSSAPKEKYGFTFTGISNLFGELDAMFYYKLDELGMEECAIVLDPANVGLVEVDGMKITPLDGLKKAGIKNVEASYVTRSLSYEHRNPKTHLLIKPKYV